MTRTTLAKLIAAIFTRTRDEGDEMLHQLMCDVYPTRDIQNA